jgi:MYXO-CTERM domain-containing protein
VTVAIVAGSLMAATDAGAVAVVMPETAIASPQYNPVQESSAGQPAVACNVDGCLAAWRDGRQGLGYRVWARRLRTDGTPRDPAAFLVSVDAFPASDPAVATNGTSFLVAWSDDSLMHLTRIDADDSLHSDSQQVADFSFGSVRPSAMASNGDGYLLVLGYAAGTAGATVRGLRTDHDGHILDAMPFPISADPAARGIADVIWAGTQYLVVWNQGQGDAGDAYGARVLADGTLLDASGFFIATLASGFSGQPRLAFGGGKVLLVAGRSSGSSGGAVGAVLLDTDGQNGRSIALPIPPSQLTGTTAGVAWNGSAFVATWVDGVSTRPVAARIAPDGTVLDSAQIVFPTAGQAQTLATAVAGSTAFIVYLDTTYQAPPIRLLSLSAGGAVTVTSPLALDVSAAPQRLLATARGNGQTLVVWADDAQGTQASALLAARVSDAGAVLDATPLVLSASVPNKQGAVVAAAWAGGQYLVSWWERNSLTTDQFQVARVSAAGALLDGTPKVLGQNLFFAQVSSIVPSGDNFLVVWSESGIISTPPPINAAFIGPDGNQIGSGFTVGPAQASYPWAVSAAEGGGFLAAWNRFSGPYGVQIETIDATGVQGSPVLVSQQQGSISLALVPSPGQTLVWLNGRAGMLLSPAPPFAALPGNSTFDVGRNIGLPSWNGAVYVSAGVTTPGLYDYDSVGVDVNVLSTDGVLLGSPTTIVPPDQLTTLAPTVVGLAPDKNLVVYSRLVPEHDYGGLRVRFQIVDSSHQSNPDGGQVTDGGPTSDGGLAVDATDGVDAVDANLTHDAPSDDLRDATAVDASEPDLARPDVGADTVATVDAGGDAGYLDAGRPETAGAGDAPALRDAAADARLGSSSGCSCAVSATGSANHNQSTAALLLFAAVACLRRRQRRRGR